MKRRALPGGSPRVSRRRPSGSRRRLAWPRPPPRSTATLTSLTSSKVMSRTASLTSSARIATRSGKCRHTVPKLTCAASAMACVLNAPAPRSAIRASVLSSSRRRHLPRSLCHREESDIAFPRYGRRGRHCVDGVLAADPSADAVVAASAHLPPGAGRANFRTAHRAPDRRGRRSRRPSRRRTSVTASMTKRQRTSPASTRSGESLCNPLQRARFLVTPSSAQKWNISWVSDAADQRAGDTAAAEDQRPRAPTSGSSGTPSSTSRPSSLR